jgi:hypothetical protein
MLPFKLIKVNLFPDPDPKVASVINPLYLFGSKVSLELPLLKSTVISVAVEVILHSAEIAVLGFADCK